MVKELQALCLDVRVLDANGDDIDISGLYDDDTPAFNSIEEVERSTDASAKEVDDEESEEDYEDVIDEDVDDFFDDEEMDYVDDDAADDFGDEE